MPKPFLKRLEEKLATPVAPYSLALYRILFGFLMVWESYRYFQRIHPFWDFPKTFFPFEVFSWLPVLQGDAMQYAHIIMGIAAAFIMLGIFFRFGCYVFFLIYSYIFVIEKSYYNNHYYLIILLVFLLSFTDADSAWSLRNALSKGRRRPRMVPYWQVFINQLQLVICYMGGAFAKINPDWLRGEPMARFLSHNYDMPYVGQYFHLKPVIFWFAYSGLLFDLLIGPALMWRKTRIPAIFALFFFHIMNNNLFSIGIFPYLGMGSVVIFIEFDTPKKVLNKLMGFIGFESKVELDTTPIETFKFSSLRTFLIIYLAVQLFLPFRYFLFKGNVSWTEEGHNFAWHMKLRAKHAYAYFRVFDGITGQEFKVRNSDFLNSKQARKITTRPHMMLQFARFLAEEYERRGVADPKVYVINVASLNGRPFQYLVKPEVDLTSVVDPPFSSADWIEPLIPNQPIGNYKRSSKERDTLIRKALTLPLGINESKAPETF